MNLKDQHSSVRRYVEIFVVIFTAAELSVKTAKLQALIEPGLRCSYPGTGIELFQYLNSGTAI